MALRLSAVLRQKRMDEELQAAWNWIKEAMLYDKLDRIKALMLGADRKSLRYIFDQWNLLMLQLKTDESHVEESVTEEDMLFLALTKDMHVRHQEDMAKMRVSLSSSHDAFRASKARFLERVLGHWRGRELGAAFDAWRFCALTRRGIAQSASQAVRHWLNRSKAQAFDTWHEHAHSQARSREILRRTAWRWRQRHLATAFFTWAYQGARQKGAKCVASRVAGHWAHRSCAAAFESWHMHSTEQRRMEDVCTRIVARVVYRVLALGFGFMHYVGVDGGIHGGDFLVNSIGAGQTIISSTATKMLPAEKVMVRDDQVLNQR